jgi:hypothetical protein
MDFYIFPRALGNIEMQLVAQKWEHFPMGELRKDVVLLSMNETES